MVLQLSVLHSDPVTALEKVGRYCVTGDTKGSKLGCQFWDAGRWGGRGGAAAALGRIIWEFLGTADGCATCEEERGYLKFKAALTSGYCVL